MSICPPSKSQHAPIFLFSNWRTGGTALALTFRKHNQFYVFTEPFNPTLRAPEVALKANTSAWKSKHPPGQLYFTEFEPLLARPDFFFPVVEDIPYVLGPDDKCDDLLRYLQQLIDFAHAQGKAPVFKFEQLEGSAAWIAANFPEGLRVGITRDKTHQFISWIEQASFGNTTFFRLASQLIQNNRDFFEGDHTPVFDESDIATYSKVFETFHRQLDTQHHRFMNVCINVAPETTESTTLQLERIVEHDPLRITAWDQVLREMRSSFKRTPETQVALERLSTIISLRAESRSLVESVNVLEERLGSNESSIAELNSQLTAKEIFVGELMQKLDIHQALIESLTKEATDREVELSQRRSLVDELQQELAHRGLLIDNLQLELAQKMLTIKNLWRKVIQKGRRIMQGFF